MTKRSSNVWYASNDEPIISRRTTAIVENATKPMATACRQAMFQTFREVARCCTTPPFLLPPTALVQRERCTAY
jgi:hypothetical protein